MLRLGLVHGVYLAENVLEFAFLCELVLIPEKVLFLVGCGHLRKN
jgi:NADH:ubiquinone oxidoreductase subunit 4 (subunit M)